MTLGQRIQELRKAQGLSQEGLGEKLGVSRQAVSRWEMDGAVPEVDKLMALSRVFGVGLNDLLGVEEGGKTSGSRTAPPSGRARRLGILMLALVCALSLGGNVWLWLRNGELAQRVAAAEGELAAAEQSLDPEQPLVVGFDVEYYLMQRDEALICYTFTVTAARQTEGMELELEVVDENGEVYTLPLELVNGSVYRGELEMRYPAGGSAAVSALVRDGLGRAYTQSVAELTGMGGEAEQVRTLWARCGKGGVAEMCMFELDGYTLTLELLEQILAHPECPVRLAPKARERCQASRSQVDRWLEKDAPAVYGINTGLGALKDVAVPAQDHIRWNRKLPYPHAAGFDEYLPPEITRLSLLLRANVLARGYSAVRPALIDRLLDLFNAGVAPAVRGHGSTGLSDLGPMSQCAMVVAGLEDASAFYRGELMPAPAALSAAGLAPGFTLECKEVLAQMNGSTMTQAIAVIAFLGLSPLLSRCLPCLPARRAAAVQETVKWVGSILERENNISCDNPLLFETEPGSYQAVMGCNCSNTQVGYAMDLLSVVLAQLGRALPFREGSSILLQRLDTLAMQVSGDSIPTKGGQEDHVEFSYTAAEKAAEGVALLRALL